MNTWLPLAGGLALHAALLGSAAAGVGSGPDYDRCLAQLARDPAEAAILADAWEATGGGEGATECRALAAIGVGQVAEGAALLEALAARSQAPGPARARLYGQAGQAWLIAGEPGRAFAASTLGLALTPDDAALLTDRAIASARQDRFGAAAEDLTLALQRDPSRTEARVLRAAALRNLGRLEAADADIARAVAAEPDNADALLERGILRQRRGDASGARQDWERAAALGADSATGDLAAQNLALLDVGPEQR